MKVKPTNLLKPAREKIKFKVTIEDSIFITSAHSEESALSNAAYRFADENDEDVALVKWKLKNDKLYFNVKEA